MVKIRLRHEWHMRWEQESLAVRERGMESSPQVRQEVFFSGGGARGVMKEENIEGAFLWVSRLMEDFPTLTSVFVRATEVAAR
jgi:hypothetical protein